ncbi:hypothetical protein GCM10008013_06620 [Paenibacillus segetis]|uniref:Uncharacterized protein n=1 Tax=Paenibacillus segetis TaxID=1325360 RepID=A0ABQ1Y5N5_9BACL|nr:hypothetical protein GCM10008013_06620 [Paenibacillus segetis]
MRFETGEAERSPLLCDYNQLRVYTIKIITQQQRSKVRITPNALALHPAVPPIF